MVLADAEDVGAGWPAAGIFLPMNAVYRASHPPGPAGRWFIERLEDRRTEGD